MTTRRILGILLTVTCLPLFRVDSQAADITDRVIRMAVSFSETDPTMPWLRLQPGTRAGYAIRLDATRLIAPERIVRNAQVVYLLPPRSGSHYQAVVRHRDPHVGLALLELQEPHALPPLDRLAFEPLTAVTGNTIIVQCDETGNIETGTGIYLRSAVQPLPSGNQADLLVTLQVSRYVNGDGVPVFRGQGLAGMILAYDPTARNATVLPADTIRRYVEDVLTPPYHGFPSVGIEWTPLIDPAKRRYLGVTAPASGILVLDCLPGSAAESVLKPHDVILSIDGHPIDELGFYHDPVLGRLEFSHLIRSPRKPDSPIRLRIVRQAVEQDLPLTPARRQDTDNLIPENLEAEPEPFLITGGLVIRELTGRYLQSQGPTWIRDTDPRLVHTYLFRRNKPDFPGQRVVILSRVLPDPVNQGYENIADAIITHINGQPVRNIGDVFTIQDRDRVIHRVRLQGIETELVLDVEKRAEADNRISRQYRLPPVPFRRPATTVPMLDSSP
ncbi:MAG: hypothetical protein A2498_14105 [Lentisphaerae bacterium RIFOXYC12_FULL_60_16]|nr:MAG: hypothetical protein A2498_14105 [Lentisphaerae bacterium RIFOXYC12_FULL_60_16]